MKSDSSSTSSAKGGLTTLLLFNLIERICLKVSIYIFLKLNAYKPLLFVDFDSGPFSGKLFLLKMRNSILVVVVVVVVVY